MPRVGFDVGGTFTDFTLSDAAADTLTHVKVPSTPDDPSRAIRDGLARLLATHGAEGRDVEFLGHGTTVATNMVIERRGAATGLLTTKGFRDVLEIGRQTRPHLYDYGQRKPEPLVPRRRRLELDERVAADGEVLRPLDEAAAREAILELRDQGIEALAIALLHSYRRGEHEARLAELAAELAPELYVSISAEVTPEFREFERTSTTVLNAFVGPRMSRYLACFAEATATLGIPGEPYTIHSNGGLMSIPTARRHPVRTVLSGPAAGVVGAARIAGEADFGNLVTFDVGGTSTDVSLVHEGRPLATSEREIAGYPARNPMIDVHVIGAGGGSIARIDEAGGLKVGPESAGAAPGPVAYGQGGEAVTLTDANMVLGRLGAAGLVGGDMPLNAEAARAALEAHIAGPLALAAERAAAGIVRIALANMTRAVRAVSTERGHDLAGFTLVAYGGAGPLHAAEIARELRLARVLVPREPGTLCARGILVSDIALDFVRTEIRQATSDDWPEIVARLLAMRAEGEAWLDGEAVPPACQAHEMALDARYLGQNHEVRVPWSPEAGDLDDFLTLFHATHRRVHGHALDGRVVEIVNCRLRAIGRIEAAGGGEAPPQGEMPAPASAREVYFDDEHGWLATPVHERGGLPVGTVLDGPTIVEEMSATTLVLPGQRASVDAHGNILIEERQP